MDCLTKLCYKPLFLFYAIKTKKMQSKVFFILQFLLSDMKRKQVYLKTVLLTGVYDHNTPCLIFQGHFKNSNFPPSEMRSQAIYSDLKLI